MPAPRHARPSRRRPLAIATAVALGAAAVAVPLSAQAMPGAPKAPVEPAVDDAHVLHVGLARLPAVHSQALPAAVIVRPGDTLSAIAGRVCGNPDDYLALAYNNNVLNPNLIYAGQVVRAACQAAAQAVADKYGLPGSSPASPPSGPTEVAATAPSSNETPSSAGSYSGSPGMQACIIAAESGGNAQVMNSTGHYGLYQFSEATWAAHGGDPADFGNASVAEQNQVYASTVAADGYSDWQPYDHC